MVGFTAFSASEFATQHLLLGFRLWLNFSGLRACQPTYSFGLLLGLGARLTTLSCWGFASQCRASGFGKTLLNHGGLAPTSHPVMVENRTTGDCLKSLADFPPPPPHADAMQRKQILFMEAHSFPSADGARNRWSFNVPRPCISKRNSVQCNLDMKGTCARDGGHVIRISHSCCADALGSSIPFIPDLHLTAETYRTVVALFS